MHLTVCGIVLCKCEGSLPDNFTQQSKFLTKRSCQKENLFYHFIVLYSLNLCQGI